MRGSYSTRQAVFASALEFASRREQTAVAPTPGFAYSAANGPRESRRGHSLNSPRIQRRIIVTMRRHDARSRSGWTGLRNPLAYDIARKMRYRPETKPCGFS